MAAEQVDNAFANSAGLSWVYVADLAGRLEAGTSYYYRVCVAGEADSPLISFTTLGGADAEPPTVIYFADLGRDHGGQAFPFLEAEADATAARVPGSRYGNVAIANGDFAYNLGDFNGARGADLMSRFSDISAQLPAFVTIGNHELPGDIKSDKNASHFVNMLGRTMPGNSNGSFYSVNVGLMHLVFLSSEVYALGPYGGITAGGQMQWLLADLASVDRAKMPWIVAIHHRPFYCSNANSWCGPKAWQANPVRLALEPVFLQFGVDVVLSAHEHSVEFTWPVKDGAATALDYNRPSAPVHIVSGVAGCNETDGESLNPMGAATGNWSRARLAGDPVKYGYSRFWAANASSFHLEQVQVIAEPTGPKLWDYAVDIFQPAHGPFA